MNNLPWRQAIVEVLKSAGSAMHYTDIAKEIVHRGLRDSVGITPAATVNANISNSIKEEGSTSPFVRVAVGEYMLRELAQKGLVGGESLPLSDDVVEAESTAIVHAFGMFWLRELVLWNGSPALLGRQQIGADPVDMSRQKGVYLLYDNRDVVYVGRAIDQPLGRRLYQHTLDRLRGRWDRFSWFGVLKVTDAGLSDETVFTCEMSALIATMEAVLIESLEPPQNRKRGDAFSAVEFLQAEDPQIEKDAMMRLLRDMEKRITKSL